MNTTEFERDSMAFDVVIVGAGIAGLSAAIRLKQLAAQQQREISVCVLEKGSEVGAHILSGAVIDPRALNELLPDWKVLGAPLTRSVTEDRILFLTGQKSYRMPIVPPSFHNEGNYIISLGLLCKWLGVKLGLVLVYIILGVICLRSRPRSVQWFALYAVSLGCIACIAYLAYFKPL